MNLKSLALTFAAGIATFLIVGVVVTELASSRIEFSLFVGIPAGLVAGGLAAAAVALGFADGGPAERRRVAGSFGAFAASFLVVLVVGSFAPVGVILLIVASIAIGALVAAITYVRDPAWGRTDAST